MNIHDLILPELDRQALKQIYRDIQDLKMSLVEFYHCIDELMDESVEKATFREEKKP